MRSVGHSPDLNFFDDLVALHCTRRTSPMFSRRCHRQVLEWTGVLKVMCAQVLWPTCTRVRKILLLEHFFFHWLATWEHGKQVVIIHCLDSNFWSGCIAPKQPHQHSIEHVIDKSCSGVKAMCTRVMPYLNLLVEVEHVGFGALFLQKHEKKGEHFALSWLKLLMIWMHYTRRTSPTFSRRCHRQVL